MTACCWVCGIKTVCRHDTAPKLWRRGLSCIINPYGEVVLSPTELKPFLQLDDIFSGGADSRTVESIRQMEQDMPQNRSGAFAFTAVDGTELILSYQPIEVNGWVLLTLVPAELIAEARTPIRCALS